MHFDSKVRKRDAVVLSRRVGVVASALCLVAGCSLVTTFPEIEESTSAGAAGQGGAGGMTNVGGSGGGQDCTPVLGNCTDCAGTAPHCGAAPKQNAVATLIGPVDGTVANSYAAVTAGTTLKDGTPIFAGAYKEHGAGGLHGKNQLVGLDTGVGFISSPDGTLLMGFSPCDGTADLVAMNAMVGFPNGDGGTLAVVGGFKGERLLPFNNTTDCTQSGGIPSHAGNGTITPFIYWFHENGTGVYSLEPDVGEQEAGKHAIFLDAAAVDPTAAALNLVAIGATTDSAFDDLDPVVGTKFFLVSSGGANVKSSEVLDFGPCQSGAFGAFDHIDGSIAIDPVDGSVWVAGSDGCGSLDTTGAPQPTGFVQRWSTTPGNPAGTAPVFGAPTATLPIGNGIDYFRITGLAVTIDSVLFAGVYTGVPNLTMADGGNPEEGYPGGDAYVVRFPRAGFTNQSKATWFQRISSDSPLTSILDFRANGGRVYVAGRIATDLGISDVYSCLTSELDLGRGFVAELDEATGAVNWLRLDGGLPASPASSTLHRGVSDTLALPYGDGRLAIASSSLGDVVLQCGEGSTDAPTVTLRALSLSLSLPLPEPAP